MLNFDSPYGRFFQIGYVTRDIDVAVPALERALGARRIDLIHDMRNEAKEEIAILHLSHLALPGVELEVIQPRLDWPSLYLDALPDDEQAVGVHHFGYAVPDVAAWDSAVDHLDAAGTPIVLLMGASNVRAAYIDTRKTLGHYSELVLRYDPAKSRPLPT